MRSGMYHVVFGGTDPTVTLEYYALGNYSYFSESAYDMDNWQNRYWGANYERLLSIKKSWDPQGVFGCRHCIGS